ncbi:MAG: ABC transporter permease, partial [Acidimicrobiia bacterium]
MNRFLRRSGYMLLILFLSSVAVFYSLRLAGGDVAAVALPASATAEQRQEFRARLGLDRPIYQQYFAYMGTVLSGDPGRSLVHGAPIQEMLKHHGKNSLILGAAAFVIVFAVGVPLGMLASIRRNTWMDAGIMSLSVGGMAIPNFWLALVFVWLFAVTLRWLPPAGCCTLRQLVLPAVVLAAEGAALT